MPGLSGFVPSRLFVPNSGTTGNRLYLDVSATGEWSMAQYNVPGVACRKKEMIVVTSDLDITLLASSPKNEGKNSATAAIIASGTRTAPCLRGCSSVTRAMSRRESSALHAAGPSGRPRWALWLLARGARTSATAASAAHQGKENR